MFAALVLIETWFEMDGYYTGSNYVFYSTVISFMFIVATWGMLLYKNIGFFYYKKELFTKAAFRLGVVYAELMFLWTVAGSLSITGELFYLLVSVVYILSFMDSRNVYNEILLDFLSFSRMTTFNKALIAAYDDNVDLFCIVFKESTPDDTVSICQSTVIILQGKITNIAGYLFKHHYRVFTESCKFYDNFFAELVVRFNPCYQLLKYNTLYIDLLRLLNKMLY